MSNTTYATNKRARFDYELGQEFTAGLVLFGHEVKSLRMGNASLKGSYITISADNEPWLLNTHINAYPHAGNITSYQPERSRKLLMNKSEIARLVAARNEKLVIVPLYIFPAGRTIKLKLAIGKPKKMHDKRRTIQKRDIEKDIHRKLKG
jgi:SsrA-binding protein